MSDTMHNKVVSNNETNTRYCDNCGFPISENNDVCDNCGFQFSQTGSYNQINNPNTNKNKKPKTLLVLLLALSLIVICGVIIFPDLIDSIDLNSLISTKKSTGFSYTTGTNQTNPTTTTTQPPVEHNLPHEVYVSNYEEFSVSNGPFNKVKASSYANWRGTVGYPYWLFDGNIYSSWQDGDKNSFGVNEWILSYNSDGTTEFISSVTVYNGYQNTEHNRSGMDFFILNSRVNNFSLEFDDGRVFSFTLSDTKSPQTFDFGETIETCFVKFKINSVYEGKWSDTCLSEIIYNR